MTTSTGEQGPTRFQTIWIDQCAAARDIKLRFSVEEAFDYLVDEKLMNFVNAALTRPEFAQELPRFISAVRNLFSQEEIARHMRRLEWENAVAIEATNDDAPDGEDDEIWPDDPAEVENRPRAFAMIRELLTAPALGTS